jgi:2-polyprenyl-3-methyl-5-hydroxy-6-metoxy-1,4-benzoquinol methylase
VRGADAGILRATTEEQAAMIKLKAPVPTNYAEQTYDSPYRIIRYPHRKRYSLTLASIVGLRPDSLLDYGAGDAHVLAELASAMAWHPQRIVAYEPLPDAARIARERMAQTPLADRFVVAEQFDELNGQTFDMIICLGVLEHMPLPERERFYRLCAACLAPGGTCLIDVPVEAGLSLAIKEGARVLLKGRRAKYSAGEFLRTVGGRVTFDPERFIAADDRTWIQDHTGFDYRLFERELAPRFELVDRFPSPFPKLPAWLFNQEMFYLIRRRA